MTVLVVRAALATDPIDLPSHEQLVADAAAGTAGAIVGFAGAVRNHDGDHASAVTKLSYSSHPSAPEVLADVVAEVSASVTGVRAVAVSHRVGDLDVGDVAFVVAVAAVRLANRAGLPTLLLYLAIGLALGQEPQQRHEQFRVYSGARGGQQIGEGLVGGGHGIPLLR